MKFAIQETMLPGETTLARLENARSMGFEGVEFGADDLSERIPEIGAALEQTGLKAAAIHAGQTRLLHPDYGERDRAIVRLRHAMTNALDLGAPGVAFIAHYSTSPVLPDLHPYKSAVELEAELLVALLRTTLTDLAYALGADLYLCAVSRQQAHLINQLYHAATIIHHIDNHPHIKIGADLCAMSGEEDDMMSAIDQYGGKVAYVHVADHNRRLPGHGGIDFRTALDGLKRAGYGGWLTLACGVPNINDPEYMGDVRAALARLRE